MTMGDDINLSPLAFSTVYAPILDKLEASNGSCVRALRASFEQIEKKQPGFLLDFIRGLVQKSELNVNLQEAFLRLQAQVPADELALTDHKEVQFQELGQRAAALRKILARIPDEMNDRRAFLETIKEIASSIKKLLDATNSLFSVVPPSVHPSIEQRKRDFVKYSKRFSNTLKDYFKGEEANLVYLSANQLIYQTCLIIKTVRDKTKSA